MNKKFIDEAIKSMWKQEEKSSTFQGIFNEGNTIEELLTTLQNESEEAITEKWIDYDTYQFERNFQDTFKC